MRRRGFTLLELLLVTAIIGVLVGVLVPMISSVRRSMASVNCISNLRLIGVAFKQYALDNGGYLPDPFVNQQSWEASLKTQVASSQIFLCPSDHEVGPTIGGSYDWRDTGKDDTTLAGRMLNQVDRWDAVLVFDALPGWHAKEGMNAAFLDGSARAMTQKDCLDDLTKPIR